MERRRKVPAGRQRRAQLDSRGPASKDPANSPDERAGAVAQLKREILAMRRYLRSLVTQQEAATEHLKAANAAILDANSQLLRMNEDLALVLAGVDVPLIVVDSRRTIRRFTERAAALLDLGEGDIGRPVPEAAGRIGVPELGHLVRESISNAVPKERPVSDRRGRRYRLRITPCAGRTGSVEGAIVLFLEADPQVPPRGDRD